LKTILSLILLSISTLSFTGDITEISVEELQAKMALKDKNIVVIDVRTPFEHLTGIIKGSIKKNAYSSDFKDYVKELDKSKTYLIYCHSGGRSHKVTNLFTINGLKAFNVKGGISAWKTKGFKTEKQKGPN
jgi:rhodanese-related sulfurtransferase